MRYYIVDNMGNILGDYESREKAKMQLESAYTKQQIKQEELEVIEG